MNIVNIDCCNCLVSFNSVRFFFREWQAFYCLQKLLMQTVHPNSPGLLYRVEITTDLQIFNFMLVCICKQTCQFTQVHICNFQWKQANDTHFSKHCRRYFGHRITYFGGAELCIPTLHTTQMSGEAEIYNNMCSNIYVMSVTGRIVTLTWLPTHAEIFCTNMCS